MLAAGAGATLLAWPVYAALAGPDNRSLESRYAGAQACVPCHAEICRTFAATGHAHSMALATPAALAELLPATGQVRYVQPASEFGYSLRWREGELRFGLCAPGERAPAVSLRVEYVIGSGKRGQSLLAAPPPQLSPASQRPPLVQLPVSYFRDKTPAGWAPSPGMHRALERNPAYLREVDERCLRCHATHLPLPPGQPVGRAVLGVSCEACHGPGAGHVAKWARNRLLRWLQRAAPDRTIHNPAGASEQPLCATCHSQTLDVRNRFDAFGYRPGAPREPLFRRRQGSPGTQHSEFESLAASRCTGTGGKRLSCAGCHDAHAPAPETMEPYNRRCAGCHSSPSCQQAPVLAPALRDCVACHMPEREPFEHSRFRNHRIAVYPSVKPRTTSIVKEHGPSGTKPGGGGDP